MTTKRTVKRAPRQTQIKHLKATIERMKASQGTLETKDELIVELREENLRLRDRLEEGVAHVKKMTNQNEDYSRQVRHLERDNFYLRGVLRGVTGKPFPTPGDDIPESGPIDLAELRDAEGRYPPHHARSWVMECCGGRDGNHERWCSYR